MLPQLTGQLPTGWGCHRVCDRSSICSRSKLPHWLGRIPVLTVTNGGAWDISINAILRGSCNIGMPFRWAARSGLTLAECKPLLHHTDGLMSVKATLACIAAVGRLHNDVKRQLYRRCTAACSGTGCSGTASCSGQSVLWNI